MRTNNFLSKFPSAGAIHLIEVSCLRKECATQQMLNSGYVLVHLISREFRTQSMTLTFSKTSFYWLIPLVYIAAVMCSYSTYINY